MIKKRLILGITCVTCLVLVAGCTKSSKDAGATSSTSQSNETKAIVSQSVAPTTSLNTTTKSSSVNNTSSNWQEGSIIIDGKTFLFPFNYQDIVSVGWDFDRAKYKNISDPYLMNKGDKVYSTIKLINSKFDAEVTVGFINLGSQAVDIKQCQIWSLEVDDARAKKPVSFSLAGGITNGSTLDDVKKAYGEPDDTYHSDSSKYYTYTYDKNSKKLKMDIYEDNNKGLVSFSYSDYKAK